MARRGSGIGFLIKLLRDGTERATSLSGRLARRPRDAILDGVLAPGTRLPSACALAVEIGAARGTVEWAYGQLEAEGFLTRRVGDGTYVSVELTGGGGEALSKAAADIGLGLPPLSRTYAERKSAKRGFILGFAALDGSAIQAGAETLARLTAGKPVGRD